MPLLSKFWALPDRDLLYLLCTINPHSGSKAKLPLRGGHAQSGIPSARPRKFPRLMPRYTYTSRCRRYPGNDHSPELSLDVRSTACGESASCMAARVLILKSVTSLNLLHRAAVGGCRRSIHE